MKISVIIPIYNNEETMERCLGAIFNQTRKPDEVIVVDCSTDSTPEIIKNKFPKVRLYHGSYRRWPSIQRNIGVKHASGDILAFTDGDVIVEPDWLEEIEKAHESHDVVGGSTANANPEKIFGWLSYIMEFTDVIPGSKARYVRHLPTCNMSYKKEIFEKHGGFPEDIEISEDRLFHYKLLDKGEKIWFEPKIKISHLNKYKLGKILKYQVKLGKSAVISRRQCRLVEHQDFVNKKWLAPLFPFGKFFTIYIRLLKRNFKFFLLAILFLPIIIIAHIIWGFAFLGEAFK